jgi:simple sugar transport system permease protein
MKKLLPTLLAFGSGLCVITVLIAFSSDNPLVSLAAFFAKPFSSWWYLGNMLNLAGLLILAGTGAAFALRAGTFNLGGEAQIYAPALVTALLLAPVDPSGAAVAAPPAAIALAGAASAAMLCGALLAAVPGIIRAALGASELLTSFLLSAAVTPILDYLVSGPLRDPGKNLLSTKAIAEAYRIPPVALPSYFNVSFFIAVILAILTALFLAKTGPGYRMTISGTAPEFARYAGFSVKQATVAGMTVSGALHGLAGFFAITGTWYMCHEGISAGMGWGALAIALIARRNPLAVIPAAILYAWIETASGAAVLSTRFSFDSTSLVQAVIFLVISVQTFGIRLSGTRIFRRRT